MLSSKILFQVSGSIAAFKSASVVSELVQRGHQVKVAFSKSASKFIGASTFEGLTGHKVYQDQFDSQEPMAHIDLARWADMMVLCPATANSIAQLANGFSEDLLGTLFLAKKPRVPYLIFPAMNSQMWAAPTVLNNCAILRELPGVKLLATGTGTLACGEVGEGRLLEPENILSEIYSALSSDKKPVLITGGGTSEPIDSVRSITNFSTGQTAIGLASFLNRNGFKVDLLLSTTAKEKNLEQLDNVTRFTTHQELENLLQNKLSQKNYFGVIHLAAVSDFKLKSPLAGKVSSKESSMNLELVPTKKLVSCLKEWSLNKQSKVIAFKLTSSSSKEEGLEKAEELLTKNQLEAVVLNDLSQIESSFSDDASHSGTLVTKDNQRSHFTTKKEMYEAIETVLKEDL